MHTLALADGAGHLVCDCGTHVENLDAWHAHTVTHHNNPTPEATDATARDQRHVFGVLPVPPGRGGEVTRCTKVACYNAGNGRECWTLDPGTGTHPLYELPSREVAEALAERGGVLAATHAYSFC